MDYLHCSQKPFLCPSTASPGLHRSRLEEEKFVRKTTEAEAEVEDVTEDVDTSV